MPRRPALGGQRRVKTRLRRVSGGGVKNAFGDAVPDDEPAEAGAAERAEVAPGVEGALGPRKLEPDDAWWIRRQRGGIDGDALARRDVALDPGSGIQTGVAGRQRAGVVDRPPQRHDRGHERGDPEPSSATREDAEDGDERQHVAVVVRLRGQQRERVDRDERQEHDVAPRVSPGGDRDPGETDERERPERLPEPLAEGKRGHRVVLEAEPAGLRKPLDARDVVPGRAGMEHDERARQQERRGGERDRAADAPPFTEARDDERDEEEHAGVLRGGGETGRDPGPFEPARDEQRERHGDAEGEEHVRDGHARVRDVGRRDGDADGADETGEAAVARSPEPPRRRDAADADEDRNDPGGAVRGLVEAELGRREDEEQEARVVVPARVEPAAVDELPRPRDEVLLVRVEKR